MDNHEIYMQRCLQLAGNGAGNVAPNPMVGCVILHKEQIIGEGFHSQFGGPHAEVVAINAVENKELLKDSCLYVNLEPCSHYGKTPPCADKIIEFSIPDVVIGTRDPYTEVQGRGIEKLKKAGCKVIEGILTEDCFKLNKRFFTFYQKKRPFIILKWAQSLDGFIDKERVNDEPYIKWITDENTRTLVHRWRSEEQAILVGSRTVLLDNPQLTVREWCGKNPLRLIIDRDIVIPLSFKVFDAVAPTVVFNANRNGSSGQIEFVKMDFKENIIPQILAFLHKRNIQSLIVEGGSYTLQSFIDQGYWDEARIFTGDCYYSGGVKAPAIIGKPDYTEIFGNDKLTVITNS